MFELLFCKEQEDDLYLDFGLAVDENILEDCLVGALGLGQLHHSLTGQVVVACSCQLRHRDAHCQQLALPAHEFLTGGFLNLIEFSVCGCE